VHLLRPYFAAFAGNRWEWILLCKYEQMRREFPDKTGDLNHAVTRHRLNADGLNACRSVREVHTLTEQGKREIFLFGFLDRQKFAVRANG
jgi:hypothetical protein